MLERASLRSKEYACPVADIPLVIEAVRQANLINVGGQLQFRFADGTTCECYRVEVNSCKTVPESLSWEERVAQTATAALRDFAEEGRRSFGAAFHDVVAEPGI
jgi:hypothetical protein